MTDKIVLSIMDRLPTVRVKVFCQCQQSIDKNNDLHCTCTSALTPVPLIF